MDINKIVDLIPALAILLSIMIIAILVINKFGEKLFDKDYSAGNIVLFISTFLFTLLLIVHLFRPQDWTADILKVLVGVLVGAGTTKFAKKEKGEGSSVDITGGYVSGDIAGHDIIKTIQNLKDAVSNIKDSVVHQNNQIKQLVGDETKSDILINTIYERGNNITGGIGKVIQYWTTRGWHLKHFTSDYQGMDGIFLVFTKDMVDFQPKVYYQNGSDTENFKELLQ